MKINRTILLSFILLVLICSLYRIIPGRPYGFFPQIAMALFGGSVISNKKLSFLLPLSSMFISDVMYEILYRNGLSTIQGFYSGQLFNYILFGAITVIGFSIKKEKVLSILAGSVFGATVFFIISNFAVWIGGLDINSAHYPKTLAGLESCFIAALPFYYMSIASAVLFSALFFGGYYLINKQSYRKSMLA